MIDITKARLNSPNADFRGSITEIRGITTTLHALVLVRGGIHHVEWDTCGTVRFVDREPASARDMEDLKLVIYKDVWTVYYESGGSSVFSTEPNASMALKDPGARYATYHQVVDGVAVPGSLRFWPE